MSHCRSLRFKSKSRTQIQTVNQWCQIAVLHMTAFPHSAAVLAINLHRKFSRSFSAVSIPHAPYFRTHFWKYCNCIGFKWFTYSTWKVKDYRTIRWGLLPKLQCLKLGQIQTADLILINELPKQFQRLVLTYRNLIVTITVQSQTWNKSTTKNPCWKRRVSFIEWICFNDCDLFTIQAIAENVALGFRSNKHITVSFCYWSPSSAGQFSHIFRMAIDGQWIQLSNSANVGRFDRLTDRCVT
jgi:hypothetical protein